MKSRLSFGSVSATSSCRPDGKTIKGGQEGHENQVPKMPGRPRIAIAVMQLTAMALAE
jgi:hypothetical protein